MCRAVLVAHFCASHTSILTPPFLPPPPPPCCTSKMRTSPITQVNLLRLSLAWNKIDGAASSLLFRALANQKQLLALDVSWNIIGTFPTPHSASVSGVNALCTLLHQSKALFHLNLSANKFSVTDVKKLGKALEENATICGLHFDKNAFGRVDSKGNLIVVESEISRRHTAKSSYSGSTCWCCGQWLAVEFEYKGDDFNSVTDVYLRLSFDGWRRDKMARDEESNRWTLTRMVPRITVTYCFSLFTLDGRQPTDVFVPDQPRCLDSAAPTSTVNFLSLETLDIGRQGANVMFEKHYDPALNGGHGSSTLWPFFWDVQPDSVVSAKALPRTGNWYCEDAFNDDDDGGDRSFWSLESSKLFGGRAKENGAGTYWDVEQLVEKACITDSAYLKPKLERMRISKEVQAELLEFVRRHYRTFHILYKGTIALSNNVLTLKNSSFSTLLRECDVIDGDAIKKRDIDRLFICTTVDKSSGMGKRITQRQAGLERYEFIEVLIRVAMLKYIAGPKDTCTASEAFRRLYSEHLKYSFYPDPEDFRKEHLYSRETETVLLAHCQNLRNIFNQYCSTTRGALGRLLRIDEFHSFFEDTGLAAKGTVSFTEAALCFFQSKFTVTDECKTDEHGLLTFIDFLECVCRMAFVADNNKAKKSGGMVFDMSEIVIEAQKRSKFRGIIVDDFMAKMVKGLMMSGLHQFNRTLSVVYSDEEAALKKSAHLIQKFVMRWRARKRRAKELLP